MHSPSIPCFNWSNPVRFWKGSSSLTFRVDNIRTGRDGFQPVTTLTPLKILLLVFSPDTRA